MRVEAEDGLWDVGQDTHETVGSIAASDRFFDECRLSVYRSDEGMRSGAGILLLFEDACCVLVTFGLHFFEVFGI